MKEQARPTLAVYKFASCDGCQLSLLNLEDELLQLAEAVDIAYFLEASSATRPGPYDVVMVEGSVTSPEEVERIQEVRAEAGTLIALGTCATTGGIQALRNFTEVEQLAQRVYPHPEYFEVLERSSPISEYVTVDFELWGCPVNKRQVLQVVQSLLLDKRPDLPRTSVCMECKRRGAVCVLVAGGVPCLGPLTQGGCGALCPANGRGCYGCFGPLPDAPLEATLPVLMAAEREPGEVVRLLRNISCNAPLFVEGVESLTAEVVQE